MTAIRGIRAWRAIALALAALASACGGGGSHDWAAVEDRAIDGSGNNLAHHHWGRAGSPLGRMAAAAYEDGVAAPARAGGPNPRAVSNAIFAQTGDLPNAGGMSAMVFQWGQFVDHDLDLTGAAAPAEPMDIPIPTGDPIFDPLSTGSAVMPFTRSLFDPETGGGVASPREQVNEITAFLDASMVYGSDDARAEALRTGVGGKLRTSAGDLLPFNTLGLPNGTGGAPDPAAFYVAGDVRANEQVGLTAMHTLFVREHNRLAGAIAAAHPDWTDEAIYRRARALVIGEVQAITFLEFLPALLGPAAPGVESVYDPEVDPGILTEFSTALFRVGHTMLSPQLMRLDAGGAPMPGGHLPLRNAFFVAGSLNAPGELDCMLRGLAAQRQQEVDAKVVDAVRNFLFGEPLPGAGFDLAALNIQRGRDHGLADYNTLRAAYGLAKVSAFDEIGSDPAVHAALATLYADVDAIDPWVGALAEDHAPGAGVGPLVLAGLVDQFTRIRDGDRFWYRRNPALSAGDIATIEATRLSDVIRRNTGAADAPDDVFHAPL